MMPGIINFDRYTKQEAFDIAVEGIRGQEYQPSERNYTCLYRGPEGRKCALGFLITDEEYSPALDKAGSLSGLLSENLCTVNDTDLRRLLTKLQYVHDDLGGVDDRSTEWYKERFEKGFQNLAQDFDLVYTPPKES